MLESENPTRLVDFLCINHTAKLGWQPGRLHQESQAAIRGWQPGRLFPTGGNRLRLLLAACCPAGAGWRFVHRLHDE